MTAPRRQRRTARRCPRDELGSSAQRDRRKRILDATLALASKGGYDAVQMRAVAERADVALGTLYRYFPSKIHLLVSALAREFERIQDRTDACRLPRRHRLRAPDVHPRRGSPRPCSATRSSPRR